MTGQLYNAFLPKDARNAVDDASEPTIKNRKRPTESASVEREEQEQKEKEEKSKTPKRAWMTDVEVSEDNRQSPAAAPRTDDGDRNGAHSKYDYDNDDDYTDADDQGTAYKQRDVDADSELKWLDDFLAHSTRHGAEAFQPKAQDYEPRPEYADDFLDDYMPTEDVRWDFEGYGCCPFMMLQRLLRMLIVSVYGSDGYFTG